MRVTNANQRAMREFSARHDSGFDQRARELRAENARRAAAASRGRDEVGEARDLAFMRSIMSTPYAEVRS